MSTAARPLRRDAERNRQLILEAATRLFAARGLGVSLDEIARAAGVGVGTVYRRFPSRERLIDALFDERVNEIVALAEAGLEDPDPWRGLVGFIEGALTRQAADRGLKELLLGTAEGRAKIELIRARMLPLGTAMVHRAQEAGALRRDFSPRDLPLLQMMLGAVVDVSAATSPELWRRFLALTLDGMRADGVRSELPVPAVEEAELDCVMSAWRPPQRRP
ncbi:MAG: TetR/AcrR family transcriptional regulator [Solirubrobacteraceae bacterium]